MKQGNYELVTNNLSSDNYGLRVFKQKSFF